MITPEFLQGCTDEQINMGVGWLEAKKANIKNRLLHSWSTLDGDVVWCGRYFKPSSYPNDAMPIAFDNSISLKSADEYDFDGNLVKQYVAYDGSDWRNVEHGKQRVWNKNPLRAICEVYLLMSNEK